MSGNETHKMTHCGGIEWTGKDGVKRSSSVGKTNTGGFYIQIKTWWDGEDAEPMTTNLGLGAESFDKVTDLLWEFRMRLSDFEIKDEPEGEA